MSKKSGSGSAGGRAGADNTLRQEEEKLQAVVLLDSYSNQFEPLSSTRAECLMPMMGDKTLLDYTIEFLIDNDVKEVVLFCTRHHQQIKAYLDTKPAWKQIMELHFIYNFKCRSVGDAMREIDAAGIIRHTFILVTATSIITNIKVNQHLELHKQTCKNDKNAVMTMLCLNKANDLPSIGAVTESATSQTVFIHNINNRILHYEYVGQKNKENSKCLIIPTQLLQTGYSSVKQLTQSSLELVNAKYNLQNQLLIRNLTADRGFQGGSIDTIAHLKTIQQRNDLIESQIYLCSPYVLHIFTDNFDYESMVEFVHGVLANEEVSGYTIYIDVFARKYGSHMSVINNLNTYYLQVMRLLTRDDLILGFHSRSNYKRMLDRMHVYLGKREFKFGNNTAFERNVLAESGCVIGEGCEFVNCYIGSNCVIGDGVKLANTIVWPNSRIGSGTVINSALVANNVKIGNNCSILENTLICNDCLIKDNSKIPERGVYCARKDTSTSLSKKQSEHDIKELVENMSNLNLTKVLSVSEDNYVKYVLSNKEYGVGDGNEEDDEDDDFGSIEGDDEHHDDDYDDDDANKSGLGGDVDKNLKYDTSHNQHFYVIKPHKVKEPSRSLANRLYQKQMSYVSNSDSDLEDDESLASSSDEDYGDEEAEEEYGDDGDIYDSDDEERIKRGPKKSGNASGADRKIVHREDTDIFYNEVIELLKSALKENLDPSNIILEINSRKHANGIQIDDLCYYLAKAVLHLPIDLNASSSSSQLNYLEALKPLLKKQITVLQNYYTKTKQSQRIFLNSLLDFFIETKLDKTSAATSFLDAYLVKTLHFMFDSFDEFLSDELIIEWFEKMESNLAGNNNKQEENLEVRKHCLTKLKPFIDWLKEDDDDDEDDD